MAQVVDSDTFKISVFESGVPNTVPEVRQPKRPTMGRFEHQSVRPLCYEAFEMLFDEFHQESRNRDISIAAILGGSELDAATDLRGRFDNA